MPTMMNSPVEAPGGTREEMLTGIVTLGASGAISSAADCKGFTVAKTGSETGRYTITLGKGYRTIRNVIGSLEISADAAPVSGKGTVCLLRGVSASGKQAFLQVAIPPLAATVGADAEAEDNAILRITVIADRGKL